MCELSRFIDFTTAIRNNKASD